MFIGSTGGYFSLISAHGITGRSALIPFGFMHWSLFDDQFEHLPAASHPLQAAKNVGRAAPGAVVSVTGVPPQPLSVSSDSPRRKHLFDFI